MEKMNTACHGVSQLLERLCRSGMASGISSMETKAMIRTNSLVLCSLNTVPIMALWYLTIYPSSTSKDADRIDQVAIELFKAHYLQDPVNGIQDGLFELCVVVYWRGELIRVFTG